MKTQLFFVSLAIYLLSSCAPSVPSTHQIPLETTVPSETPRPSLTPYSSLTPTSTPRPQPNGAFNLNIEFSGLDDPDPKYGSPDASIASGPEVLVLARNQVAGILDKTGRVLDVKPMDEFFQKLRGSGVDQGTDPFVIYDRLSERFFFVKADYPDCMPECGALITLAVSKSSYPTSLNENDWYFYAIDRSLQLTSFGITDTDYYGDRDTLAYTDKYLAISWDVDSYDNWLGPGGQVRFIEKSPLLNGVIPEKWNDIVGLPGHVALNWTDEGDIFIVQNDNPPGTVKLFILNEPFDQKGYGIIAASFNTKLDPFDVGIGALQQNGKPIDLMVGPPQSIRQGQTIWVASVVGKYYASGVVTAINWMEIDISAWPDTRIVQKGVLSDEGIWYFAPAIMADEMGNMVIVYEQSSPDQFVSIRYTGRLTSDPLGTLRPSGLLFQSEYPFERIENERNRFVDYLGISLDPVDGSIWIMGVYPNGGGKSGTWVGNIDWTISEKQ